MSRLAARVLTGTTLAVVAAGLLWLDTRIAPGRLALFVAGGLALVSVWELERMGSFRGRKLGWTLYPATLACAALVGVDLFDAHHLPAGLVLVALYPLAAALAWPWIPTRFIPCTIDIRDGHERLPVARETVPLALWLLPPLFALVLVDRDFGVRGLIALIALSKIGDNAGFFVGRAIGKRHPFPNVSPGKTVAGCVASLVAGIAGGALILPLTLGARTPAQYALGALVGGLINVAAQASDLSESWVKRRAGVKDSSALLGPSGGVLDVIDSLFFAAPLGLLLFTWLYSPSAP